MENYDFSEIWNCLHADPISLLRVIHHLANQCRINMYSFKLPKREMTLYSQQLAGHYISLYFEGIRYERVRRYLVPLGPPQWVLNPRLSRDTLVFNTTYSPIIRELFNGDTWQRCKCLVGSEARWSSTSQLTIVYSMWDCAVVRKVRQYSPRGASCTFYPGTFL